jgi:DNA polymerase-3 subunit epsilon
VRFAAIDFETASGAAASACSLGVAIVESGAITERREWLIRPPSLRFSPINIQVHGITPERVAHEPEFDALWPQIERMIGGRPLVAHNAAFDMGVLRATWAHYHLEAERAPFLCSVALARRCWPQMRGHSLGVLAQEFGIVFQHHNSLEDADTAARIVLQAAEEYSAETLEELLTRTELRLGEVSPGGYKSCRRIPRRPKPPKITYVPEPL